MCRNTDDFLQDEEIDIHGLSNLSDHKIIRFKYPKSMLSSFMFSLNYNLTFNLDIDSLYHKDYRRLSNVKLRPRTRFGDSGD